MTDNTPTSSAGVTSAAEMIELAERAEALSGPWFVIEQEIADAVGHDPRARLPNYTASLDAAMSLVPGGWRTVDHHEQIGDDDPGFIWRLAERGADFGRAKAVQGEACTPALALVSAALRARAQAGGGTHG